VAGFELDILDLVLTGLVEVLIREELPLAGKVSMVIGVSILILLVVVADLILHTVTTVLKLRPLISEPDRLLLPFEGVDGNLPQEGMISLIEGRGEDILHLEGQHLSPRVILVDPLVKTHIYMKMFGILLRGHILTWNPVLLDTLSLVLLVCALALTITTSHHFLEGTVLVIMTSHLFLEGTATETLLGRGVVIHVITMALVLVMPRPLPMPLPQLNMVGVHSDHTIEAGILEAVITTTRWYHNFRWCRMTVVFGFVV